MPGPTVEKEKGTKWCMKHLFDFVDYSAYSPTNHLGGCDLLAIFALNSFTLKESTYSVTLAIFNTPLSSLVKLKRSKISWVNGMDGKARVTFAYREGANELIT